MASMEYLLTVGSLVVGFLALALIMRRALAGATEIESYLMALPF